jgi:hypothetical protein
MEGAVSRRKSDGVVGEVVRFVLRFRPNPARPVRTAQRWIRLWRDFTHGRVRLPRIRHATNYSNQAAAEKISHKNRLFWKYHAGNAPMSPKARSPRIADALDTAGLWAREAGRTGTRSGDRVPGSNVPNLDCFAFGSNSKQASII